MIKRSEKLCGYARQSAGWCAVLLTASVAAGVWATRAAMSDGPGGVLAWTLTLVVLRLAWWHGAEALRLARLVFQEMDMEHERAPEVRL